jgi:pteridine reductase
MAPTQPGDLTHRVALVTGGARRIGAHLASTLHARGAHVAIHCHQSRAEAQALAASLNRQRPGSATVVAADLRAADGCARAVTEAGQAWGRLDVVVNNASTFYPTPIDALEAAHFDDLIGSNLRAPAFVAQAATPWLRAVGGNIVNLADVYGMRPLRAHSVYCAAKAGVIMLTHGLAQELAPDVRVNAIAPGSILWPEGPRGQDPEAQAAVVAATPLARQGSPDDIARALLYLAADAPFVTGEVLSVDGGRAL